MREIQNKLVTREHMSDYVRETVRNDLAAYHARIMPVVRWYIKRQNRWYRRLPRELWRWLKSKLGRSK
jgi:hypothetical protein